MAAHNWQTERVVASAPRTPAGLQTVAGSEDAAEPTNVNLEELAGDQVERLIEARFEVAILGIMYLPTSA